jgi:glycosyltransferase involved in cell wall biosynthesis
MTPGESFKDFLPKISLVTPVFNSVRYIEQTILSVLAQNYPNLEYFIIDGGSTDGTLDIIRKYQSQITGWLSEPDKGMYDAINKGFSYTSGDIMGWISATDVLQAGGLSVVGTVFYQFPQVEWITGRQTLLSEEGEIKRVDPPMRWSRYSFLLGASQRHIQQESTYWRRSLWERAGGSVDATRRSAGDFELWVRFFRQARLYTVDSAIGAFREHADSGSLSDRDNFNNVCDKIAETELREKLGLLLGAYKWFDSAIGRIPKIRAVWYFGRGLTLKGLYAIPGPIIVRKDGDWRMRFAITL